MASLDDIRNIRIEKMTALKKAGRSSYPIESKQDHTINEVIEKFETLSKGGKSFWLVGRVLALRPQGAIIFLNFNDGTGVFQALLKKGEAISDADFDLFNSTVDAGDFINIKGSLFVTKRGEKTLQVKEWEMLAKSLRPLPEKWHGLQDVEERFRRRYLDILMNEEVRNRFITRSHIVTEIRNILDKNDYLEVETPVLQSLAGGASAEPFETHHKALDIDMHLRIATELHLKELLVAGYPKVYELGRLFRNEGIDVTHNPEFTTVEFYESFADAKKQRAFVEKMVKSVVKKVKGDTKVVFGEETIDFSKKFAVIRFYDLLKRFALISNPESMSLKDATLKANQLGVKITDGEPIHKILDNIYKKTCRPKLIQPTFIVDYPVAFSPLAKNKEDHPEFIDRFQLIIGGYELVNAFSELNDPIEQKKRFMEQEKNKEMGDHDAQPNDEEYVEAMEYGMPPAGGVGLSIDRLTMLVTNTKNIREVILFPTLRPRS